MILFSVFCSLKYGHIRIKRLSLVSIFLNNYIMNTEEDDLLVYDEDEAVKFILNHLPSDAKVSIDDTKVEYVLDVIYEYYDENGLIQEDTTEEASIDEEAMFLYIRKCIKKDKINITDEEIQLMLEAEYEYGKSIGVYN